MGNKKKGSNAERELIHYFWANGWVACRVAGSGSMQYPSPDILASKKGLHFAIECKSTREKYKYLKKEEIEQLITYSQKSGVEPMVALRFLNQPWLFVRPDQLSEKETSYGITLKEAKTHGKTFEELIDG